jgi:acetylornithine deacetylase/succinyl-diaminopimelate desuccinylase-like protein
MLASDQGPIPAGRCTIRTIARILISCFLFAATVLAQANSSKLFSNSISEARHKEYADLSVQLAKQYFQIDTTNPPGNESRTAAWLKGVLDKEGIENQVFEYAPGRSNLIARLKGSGAKRPIILLGHEDVVTSVAERWKHPPFSAAEDGGYIYARGSEDMKNEGIAHLMTLIMLKREKVALDRDVILLATGDEEVGDTGTDWMIANHKDLFADAEFLITEGGRDRLTDDGKVQYIGINNGGKLPFWLIVSAEGSAGHGSRPIPDSAANRLVRALNRIVDYKTPLRVLPTVDRFFKAMAKFETGERKRWFMDLNTAIKDPKFRRLVENDENMNYMFRDTITLTQMEGSHQTNVIPSIATAHLDVRLLPGEDPDKFLADLKHAINDPKVKLEPERGGPRPGKMDSVDTDLFHSIERAAVKYFPGTTVTPWMDSGYTENETYRQLGIICYGFNPYTSTDAESHSEHNDNERIRIEELRRGPFVMLDVVAGIAAK